MTLKHLAYVTGWDTHKVGYSGGNHSTAIMAVLCPRPVLPENARRMQLDVMRAWWVRGELDIEDASLKQ
jgi:hypothetical protein